MFIDAFQVLRFSKVGVCKNILLKRLISDIAATKTLEVPHQARSPLVENKGPHWGAQHAAILPLRF
jgi:hypothetical protein